MKLRIFIENLAEEDLEEHIDFIAADSPPRMAFVFQSEFSHTTGLLHFYHREAA